MKKLNNPFELHSYYGPQYFCDRIDEVAILNEALINRKNTIISSLRRLGKTNLLLHWQNSLKSQKKTATIYIDVLHTKSDAEFLQLFVNAAVKAIDKGQGFLQVAIKSFASLKPTITIDQYSGEPSLSFDVQASQRVDKNFTEAFKLLSDEFDTVSIAIDEFQQVQNYETTSQIEAIIRSNNTLYPNLHFVFSGSQEHILADMFSNPKKPLYASTQHVSLGKIGYRPYFEFIKEKFDDYKKQISDEAIHEILTWTRQHTFYTHFLANEVFARANEEVEVKDINYAKTKVLKLFEVNYSNILSNLSNGQKALITAIGKEGEVSELYNREFLSKYKLAASSVTQALQKMLEKDLIKVSIAPSKQNYFIQDVFLVDI